MEQICLHVLVRISSSGLMGNLDAIFLQDLLVFGALLHPIIGRLRETSFRLHLLRISSLRTREMLSPQHLLITGRPQSPAGLPLPLITTNPKITSSPQPQATTTPPFSAIGLSK